MVREFTAGANRKCLTASYTTPRRERKKAESSLKSFRCEGEGRTSALAGKAVGCVSPSLSEAGWLSFNSFYEPVSEGGDLSASK